MSDPESFGEKPSVPPFSTPEKPLAPGLYLVSTPIGNLEDITLRALRVLRCVDRIACEDTRQTHKLLHHFGIGTPTVSLHLHNEQDRGQKLLEELKKGSRVAVVSDAGTPAIADPGELLVRSAIDAGIPVFPVPGANAALAALVVSGLGNERFTFNGFLPSKSGQRRTRLETLRATGFHPEVPAATEVFYEAPHRILDTLADCEAIFGPDQPLVLGRELTKLHEEVLRGPVAEVRSTLGARDTIRGEFVLLLRPSPASAQPGQGGASSASLVSEVETAMRDGQSEMDALKQVAKARGLGKSEAYREWQRRRR